MKKRIRKKRHVREFKQYGNVFIIKTDGNEQTAEDILTKLEPLIENHSLIIAGGGAGRILIPSKKNNKYIPTIAALITTSIAQGLTPTDEMMFCVYVKGAKEVPQEALDAIKEIFKLAGVTRNVVVRNSLTGEQEIRPINEIASSHIARRTFVDNIYKKFKDQSLVSELSGHAPNSAAFARYREVDEEMKREMVSAID